MKKTDWQCPKCGSKKFETGQFGATGGAFTKFFNIQNKKFHTLSCRNCGYTEVYKAETSTLGNIFDFLGN